MTHVGARAELEGLCSCCKPPAGSCPPPAASLTIFWAPRVESCIFPSVCPPPREQERPCLVEEVEVMLLEKVTMPRLASPHLPGLHPCPFIFLFSLCEQSPLPELSSPTPYGWARSQPRGSKGSLGGTVVSSPTSRGRGGSTGAPRCVSAVPGTPLPSVCCGAASPKMPLVSSADSWHDEPAQWLLPTAAPGRGGALPGTRRARGKGFGSGKAFPCCKAAIVHRHEEVYRRSYLNACGNNFPV